ncbi:MAG: SGNH/GDSL hydrolase family protein [Streptosporangiaceae bacterium]|jgi:lysophospholipase L1-like esterase
MKHVRIRPRSVAALGVAIVVVLGLGAVRAAAALATSGAKTSGSSSEHNPGWVGTWEAAQTVAATSGLSDTGFDDQTVRNIVHTSVGGSEIKIRISNVFGTGPLTVTAAYVGLRSTGAAIEVGTDTEVTFGGSDSVTIAAGDRVLSDPVKLAVGSETDLAISLYFSGATGPATWHPSATSTNYYASGNDAGDTSATDYTNTDTSWYFLDGVDVYNPQVRGAVVAFGASTTDGTASTTDANERWTDDLARRLLELPVGQQMSVLDAGISGDQLLTDGGTSGAAGVARFYQDAIENAGVKDIVIWLGENDIGDNPTITASQLTNAYTELIEIAHANGVKVIGATLQPDQGASYYTVTGNVTREQVNHWILTSGAFDASLDFSTVLENPADPDELLPAYNSGDSLHPNDAGYLAIADSVNLDDLITPLGIRPDVFSGFGTVSEPSLTLGAGASATETVTVQSLSGRSYTLPWAVSGLKVSPSRGSVTIPANGTATIQLTVTAPVTAGSYPATLNLEDTDGVSAAAVAFTVVTDTPGDLAPFYDNTGISDDGAVDQANLDGNGYSYSEQQLTAAGLAPGATVTVGDLQFTWPDVAAGEPDNIEADGQTVVPDVPTGASEVGFLGTGTNSGTAGSEGEVTINYTDGTTSAAELGFGGYALGFGGPVLFGNDVVATLPYINYDNGTTKADDMYVFEATAAVNADKTVASITLPTTVSNGQLHVFALSRPVA